MSVMGPDECVVWRRGDWRKDQLRISHNFSKFPTNLDKGRVSLIAQKRNEI